MTDSVAQSVSVELLACDVDNDELATFYKSKSRKVRASSTSFTKL